MKNFLGCLVSVACQVTVLIAIPCLVRIHRQACGRQNDGWYGIVRLGLFQQVRLHSASPNFIIAAASYFPCAITVPRRRQSQVSGSDAYAGEWLQRTLPPSIDPSREREHMTQPKVPSITTAHPMFYHLSLLPSGRLECHSPMSPCLRSSLIATKHNRNCDRPLKCYCYRARGLMARRSKQVPPVPLAEHTHEHLHSCP